MGCFDVLFTLGHIVDMLENLTLSILKVKYFTCYSNKTQKLSIKALKYAQTGTVHVQCLKSLVYPFKKYNSLLNSKY